MTVERDPADMHSYVGSSSRWENDDEWRIEYAASYNITDIGDDENTLYTFTFSPGSTYPSCGQ